MGRGKQDSKRTREKEMEKGKQDSDMTREQGNVKRKTRK